MSELIGDEVHRDNIIDEMWYSLISLTVENIIIHIKSRVWGSIWTKEEHIDFNFDSAIHSLNYDDIISQWISVHSNPVYDIYRMEIVHTFWNAVIFIGKS